MIKDVLINLRDRFKPNNADPAKNVGCTEFEVDSWSISKFIVYRLVPIVGLHPYPLTELNLMVSAVCRLKPQQVFEWGTNIGKSARILHEIGEQFGIKMNIHSVDLPDDQEDGERPKSSRGRMVKGRANVTLHQGDGLSTAIELYKRNPKFRTLVFIDGDHSYESVLREPSGVTDEVPNAHILLHDTFYQSDAAGYNIGPHRAASETLERLLGKYRVMSTTTRLPGMTLRYNIDS